MLLYRAVEGWVVFVALSVAELFHQPSGGVAKVQRDRRQGAFVVPQTGLYISIRLVDGHRLGCSCQIDRTLSQDHLSSSEVKERRATEVRIQLL